MYSLRRFLAFAVPLRLAIAQAIFETPALGEVVNGGSNFEINFHPSASALYLSQMNNCELLLLSGASTASVDLYSWYLDVFNASTIRYTIFISSSIASNAEKAYFMGIRGSLKSNTSVLATYFSERFTLANMTGPSDSSAKGTSNSANSEEKTARFPPWAYPLLILGTASLSLLLVWGYLCICKRKRKQVGMTQYCEKIPLEWLSQSPQSPKQNQLIKSPYNEKYTCKGRKVQQMPHLDTSPKQLDTSTCSVFELDGSDIQRPGDIWRNSWHTVRGLVIGGRAGGTPTSERSERSLSVVPDLPIPSSAAIARRNEVRWKPSYLGS
ncbi:hypothetical protein B0O99DRAFT_589241 [Bisporella sp. PMI_857]|nr:hypothetical protein B0O99DRAFT_589241 [Bisporella sp. PMI_857]